MANGRMFDPKAVNARMLHVPLDTAVQVRNAATGRAISVTVTDGRPYVAGRGIDLTETASEELAGVAGAGIVQVKVDVA